MNDITIGHWVGFPFQAEGGVGPAFGQAAGLQKSVIGHDLGPNKAPLDVRVNGSSSFDGWSSSTN